MSIMHIIVAEISRGLRVHAVTLVEYHLILHGGNSAVEYINWVTNVAVPGRNWTFRCVFLPRYRVQSAVVQYFH